jgi:hypothetical protein
MLKLVIIPFWAKMHNSIMSCSLTINKPQTSEHMRDEGMKIWDWEGGEDERKGSAVE